MPRTSVTISIFLEITGSKGSKGSKGSEGFSNGPIGTKGIISFEARKILKYP